MKTIISKAGPPEGQSQQQGQSNYQSSKSGQEIFQSADDGRFSRFGGNDLGRGLSIIPIAYGSELSKKLTAPPSAVGENEISRRYGYSNNSQNNSGKEGQATNKPADYNDIIKDYIAKFIEPKGPVGRPGQQINPSSIKLFNVPMKNVPNMARNEKNGEKPKFKIIKEFRVTLDDLKKLKLAPFVLPPKNGHNSNGAYFPQNMQNGRNLFNGQMRPGAKWSNFNPMNGAESSRSNIYNSPKRMGETPPPRHNGSFARRRLNADRPFGPANANARVSQEQKSALKGISPPNLVFKQESRGSEPFRRSSEDQAFFESQRLRP